MARRQNPVQPPHDKDHDEEDGKPNERALKFGRCLNPRGQEDVKNRDKCRDPHGPYVERDALELIRKGRPRFRDMTVQVREPTCDPKYEKHGERTVIGRSR